MERSQGLALRTRFFVLDWTLNFTGTIVTIDGQRRELPWGEHFFPPDQVVQASYRAPKSMLVAFLPGKLTIAPPAQ